MKQVIRMIAVLCKKYFSISAEKENEIEVIESIKKDSVFKGSNVWVLIFAIFLASLGLNVNSTAVIIGAMLISPLMGPIVGMGLSIGISDFELLKRSFRNYLVATIISVLTATIFFLVSPISEAQSELLARTSPSLYDVLIALFGGAAGIVAICTKGKGNVIPGVAIATALMPPLCTAGFGLATGHSLYFIGAFYLYFINSVFIAFATFIGVRLLKYERKVITDVARAKKVGRYIVIIVVITMLPATIMTYNIIHKSLFESNVSSFISKEVKQSGTQVLSYDISKQDSTLKVVTVGREISDSTVRSLQEKMRFYSMEAYKLQVIQGTSSNAFVSDKNIDYNSVLNEDQKLIKNLADSLSQYKKYDKITLQIRDEIKVLYPNVQSISICQSKQVGINTTLNKDSFYAIVELKDKTLNSPEDNKTLISWLKTRCKQQNLKVIFY